MACVVTEICIDCKHINCVDVCPVDAIVYEDFASIEDIEFNEKYSKLWNNITTSKGNN